MLTTSSPYFSLDPIAGIEANSYDDATNERCRAIAERAGVLFTMITSRVYQDYFDAPLLTGYVWDHTNDECPTTVAFEGAIVTFAEMQIWQTAATAAGDNPTLVKSSTVTIATENFAINYLDFGSEHLKGVPLSSHYHYKHIGDLDEMERWLDKVEGKHFPANFNPPVFISHDFIHSPDGFHSFDCNLINDDPHSFYRIFRKAIETTTSKWLLTFESIGTRRFHFTNVEDAVLARMAA